ncbi:MAG: hypothetical protein IKE61_00715 [Coriobacteriales bacterium]|nr:hypothetical protein [Coriobacteriales bacterium]
MSKGRNNIGRKSATRLLAVAFIACLMLAVAVPLAVASFTGSSATLGITTTHQSRSFVETDAKAADKIKVETQDVDSSSLSQLEAPISRTEAIETVEEKVDAAPFAVVVNKDENGWVDASASVYGIGDGFLYETCADGSIVTESSMGIAAPSWIPLGTQIELSYNGKTCIATVCDRGNFEQYGRTFDLQPAVANALGIGNTVVTLQWRYA